jgi:hypothetical protein
MSNYRLQTDLS